MAYGAGGAATTSYDTAAPDAVARMAGTKRDFTPIAASRGASASGTEAAPAENSMPVFTGIIRPLRAPDRPQENEPAAASSRPRAEILVVVFLIEPLFSSYFRLRQIKFNLEAPRGDVSRLDVTAVLPRNLANDGKAQAGPSGLGREGRLEQARDISLREAGPVVGDADHHAVAAELGRQLHSSSGRAERFHGVARDVCQSPGQELTIGAHGETAGVGFEADRGRCGVRPHGLRERLGELDALPRRLRQSRIVGELGCDPAERLRLRQDVGDALLEHAAEGGIFPAGDRPKVFGREPDRRERVLDLVGDDSGHLRPGAQPVRARQVLPLLRQRLGHRAEGVHQPGELLVAGRIDSRHFPARYRAGRLHELADRPGDCLLYTSPSPR